MSASLVRGACPGLSAPMPTGDGLLVRLTPDGAMDIDAFVALCALALRHGNGVMEITARGNVQVRGLTPQSAPPFADAVAELRRTYEFLELGDSGFLPRLKAHPNRQAEKPELDSEVRDALIEAYAEDVSLLARDFPEIDIGLWPNFAAL